MAAIDEDKLLALAGRAITDWGAVAASPLVVIGDRLGLYRAMADGQPVSSAELAARTGTVERYVREWLASQAAGGYISYAGNGQYLLSPEQQVALTDENSPFCLLGGFEAFCAAALIAPRLAEAFRTGEGIGWHDHDPALFAGVARFFRPGYAANLVPNWLPALDGVVGKLTAGGKVADVGCGYGHSTLLMAEAFRDAIFVGYDYHAESVDIARKLAAAAGLQDHVSFEAAGAKDFTGRDFDLIAYFDCLHDMGDPVGALTHARGALAPDGMVMLVEPLAGDDVDDNLNPLGRLFYSASTLICTPNSLSQEVGAALGAQAGEKRMRAVAEHAGFTRFRRAAETPFNLIYEIRP